MGIRVDCSSKRHALLLPSRQRNALLANLGLVAAFKDLKVCGKSAAIDYIIVSLLVKLFAEQDVVAIVVFWSQAV